MPKTIDQNLQAIMDATYGEEVRGAIHDSIAQCYDDVTEGVTKADRAASDAQAIITRAQGDVDALSDEVDSLEATIEQQKTELTTAITTQTQRITDEITTQTGRVDTAVASSAQATTAAQTVVDSAQNLVENLASEYDPSQTYSVGDLCLYEYELYRCASEIETAEAWNSAHWTRTSVDDELRDRIDQEGIRIGKLEDRVYVNLGHRDDIPYQCFEEDYTRGDKGIVINKIGSTFVVDGVVASGTYWGYPVYVFNNTEVAPVSGGETRYSPVAAHTNSNFVLKSGHTYEINLRMVAGKISSQKTSIGTITYIFVMYDADQGTASKQNICKPTIPAQATNLDASTIEGGTITVRCEGNTRCGLIFYDSSNLVYDGFTFVLSAKDVTDLVDIQEDVDDVQSFAESVQDTHNTVLAASYDENETYFTGDYVQKDGMLYRCTNDISTPEAWTEAHWQQVTIGSEFENAALANDVDLHTALGVVAEPYDATKTYSVGDYAIYEDVLYRCLATGVTGIWTGTQWTQVIFGDEVASIRKIATDGLSSNDWVETVEDNSQSITFSKTWPVVKVSSSRSPVGYRYYGFSTDSVSTILQSVWSTTKEALTNPNLILRAGRTYLVKAKILSGIIAASGTSTTFNLFFVYYDPATDTSYREYLATFTVSAEGSDVSGAETINIAITPTADVQYGFVMQDVGPRSYDNLQLYFDLQDITDVINPPVTGAKASTNIETNQYFMVGNRLYYSTRAITSGSNITPGTNCNSVSIADALNAIANQ